MNSGHCVGRSLACVYLEIDTCTTYIDPLVKSQLSNRRYLNDRSTLLCQCSVYFAKSMFSFLSLSRGCYFLSKFSYIYLEVEVMLQYNIQVHIVGIYPKREIVTIN